MYNNNVMGITSLLKVTQNPNITWRITKVLNYYNTLVKD